MSIDNQTEIFLIPEDSKEQFSKLLTPEACERLGERTILALGASHDGVACGAVAAFFGAGIADIISVFVAEGFRCKGVGKALIDGILTSAKRVGVSQIQVVYNEAASENLMPFLKKLGFSNEDEGITAFKLTLETLKHMVLPEVSTDEIVSFDMISMSLLNEYNAGPGAPENGDLPLFMSEIDKDISSACLTT